MSIAPQLNIAAGSLGTFERLALGWQAKLFLFLGLRAKAMTIFKQVLARAPNDVNALNSLAYEAQLQERPAEALSLYQQVAELHGMAWVWCWCAWAACRKPLQLSSATQSCSP